MSTGNGCDRTEGIGSLIRRYRQERQMSQRQLASAAGISLGTLRDLEQGRTRGPRWGAVEDLVAVLGLGLAQRAELTRARRVSRPTTAGTPPSVPAGLRIDVLGPLVVRRGGETVSLGSPRQRAVLGLLALQESRGIHRDSIIDALWPDRPPSTAVTKVQAYLSRLRKLLGDYPIVRIDACYRLDGGTCGLDLTVFRDLIRQAQQAASRLDHARACDLYQRALGLWRGDVLADIDLLREHPSAVEAECRRCEAVLGYAETAASAGYNDRVLPDLRELCAREPLNETAQAHLMLALAAAGQQAAALRVFTNTRDRLSTELGIDPSPVLAGAHIQVLRQSGRLHR